MSNKSSSSINVGWLGLLGVILVTLKVMGIGQVAAWSWWLVLLPFYFGFAVVIGILVIGGLGAVAVFGVAAVADSIEQKRQRVADAKRLEELKRKT
jgi:small Trp-rich protein